MRFPVSKKVLTKENITLRHMTAVASRRLAIYGAMHGMLDETFVKRCDEKVAALPSDERPGTAQAIVDVYTRIAKELLGENV
jgi:hypothetical protein